MRGDLRGAERAFSQHPLFGALEVAGGVGGLTRGVGAGLRGLGAEESALAVRRGLARAGSTRREALDAGGIPVARGYSKDPLRKVGQVAYDKLLAQRVAGTRSYRERHQRQLADYAASRANSAERLTREHQAQFARGAAPTRVHGGGAVGRKIGEILDRTLPSQPIHGKGRVAPKGFYRPERDLVGMVLEGVLRSPKTFVADLRKERARLNAAAADRSQFHDPAELAANRERARLIDRVLADPKAVGNAQGVFKAADEIAPVLQSAERDAVKSGALQPTRVARPKLIPYAIAHMGAKVNPVTEELEINGRRVENGQIRAHMTANGVNPALIQHLPHTLKLRGARAYHRPFGIARLNYEGAQHRTGSLFLRGASPNDYTHVLETLVGKHTTLSNIHEFDRLLSNVGVKRPDGQYFTAPEAEAFLRNRGRDSHGNQIPGYQDLTPVRAFSSRGTDLQAVERQQALRSHPDETPLMEQHFANRMNMAGDRGARNVVLVPGTVLEQLRKHIEVGRFRSPKGQAFQSAFRRSVLPFSTKWLFGNTFEAALRNATRGVAPHDPIVARRLFRSMIEQDKHAGNAAQAELSGGLIFGRRGLTVRRTAGEAFGPVGARVAHLPVVKEATGIMREATDGVFALNRVLEREAELAAIGKYTRQRIQELTGSWTKAIRVQQQALDQVAKGLLDTSEQVRLAHYLNETLGQYSRFSPGMRNFIQTYAPFLPWYLNAVRFTAVTLPLHHTLKTAVLTRTEAEFQKDWEAQHKSLGGKAPDLMSAIPHKGGFIDLARFTPFGVLAPIAAGDRSVLASPLLPQITGIQQALLGKDPFGQDLRTPGADGKLRPLKGKEVTWNILNQLVGELAPGFSDYQRLRGAGSTQYPVTSLRTLVKPKTKPGTKHGSALNRVFNPLQPVFLRPQAKGGGKAIDPVDAALKAIDQAHGGTVNNDAVDQALRQIGG